MGSGKKGYKAAPWVFKGRALYQLNLVKTEEARRYIPANLHIVSFFGYTLGGFFLARYDDSPVGPFDECVALAGIVWNKPTSCAWASRVYVTNREARDHGRQHVGLPSRVCTMAKVSGSGTSKQHASWWEQARSGDSNLRPEREASDGLPPVDDAVVLAEPQPAAVWQVWRKLKSSPRSPVCKFSGFPSGVGRKGPRVRLKLPSFSGLTEEHPEMLHYTCQIDCRLRAFKPLSVSRTEYSASHHQHSCGSLTEQGARAGLVDMIGSRPVMAIAFDDMEMTVQEPGIFPNRLMPAARWEISHEAPSLVASI